uniref:LsmAD domain-containing protein n=1 Tax=Panagrellus redivivus TaxID=6233 RepID=A0A7E4VJX0_PANRE
MGEEPDPSLGEPKGDIEGVASDSGKGSSRGSEVGELPWDWLSIDAVEDPDTPDLKDLDLITDAEFDSLFLRSPIEDELCGSAPTSVKSLETENLHWQFERPDEPETPLDRVSASTDDLLNAMNNIYNKRYYTGDDQSTDKNAAEYSKGYRPANGYYCPYNHNRLCNRLPNMRGRRGRGSGYRGGYSRPRNDSFRSNYNGPPTPLLDVKPFYPHYHPSTFEVGVWGDTEEERHVQLEFEQSNEPLPLSFGPPSPLPFISDFEIGVWNEADLTENYRSTKGYVLTSLMESEKRRIDEEIADREKRSETTAERDRQPFKPKSYDAYRHRRAGDSAYDTASTTSSNDEKQRFFNADSAEATDA